MNVSSTGRGALVDVELADRAASLVKPTIEFDRFRQPLVRQAVAIRAMLVDARDTPVAALYIHRLPLTFLEACDASSFSIAWTSSKYSFTTREVGGSASDRNP